MKKHLKFEDRKNSKIVQINLDKPEEGFWDSLWEKELRNLDLIYEGAGHKSLVGEITKTYLKPKDGPIIEGGCGIGNIVFLLNKMGYDVIGLDNAKRTIDKVKTILPQLKIQYGDVRNTDFPDNHFAGYWSLGVIEHELNGYEEILKEMERIIKPGGYLFLTFPYISPFRQFKLRFNLYKVLGDNYQEFDVVKRKFYQFMLKKEDVIKKLKDLRFNLKYSTPHDGIKGLKDEIFIFRFFFHRFLHLLFNSNNSSLLGVIRQILDKILVKVTANIILLVFQKD